MASRRSSSKFAVRRQMSFSKLYSTWPCGCCDGLHVSLHVMWQISFSMIHTTHQTVIVKVKNVHALSNLLIYRI